VLYTETNKPEELKKWRAERAKYPTPNPADRRRSNLVGAAGATRSTSLARA
jgi:hypothetical protein